MASHRSSQQAKRDQLERENGAARVVASAFAVYQAKKLLSSKKAERDAAEREAVENSARSTISSALACHVERKRFLEKKGAACTISRAVAALRFRRSLESRVVARKEREDHAARVSSFFFDSNEAGQHHSLNDLSSLALPHESPLLVSARRRRAAASARAGYALWVSKSRTVSAKFSKEASVLSLFSDPVDRSKRESLNVPFGKRISFPYLIQPDFRKTQWSYDPLTDPISKLNLIASSVGIPAKKEQNKYAL